ncbi:MAG: hypothetical protein KF878_09515 [Planctomycetes bacterium]|nr:hypothetical protein [Planctomycetota bacterium]
MSRRVPVGFPLLFFVGACAVLESAGCTTRSGLQSDDHDVPADDIAQEPESAVSPISSGSALSCLTAFQEAFEAELNDGAETEGPRSDDLVEVMAWALAKSQRADLSADDAKDRIRRHAPSSVLLVESAKGSLEGGAALWVEADGEQRVWLPLLLLACPDEVRIACRTAAPSRVTRDLIASVVRAAVSDGVMPVDWTPTGIANRPEAVVFFMHGTAVTGLLLPSLPVEVSADLAIGHSKVPELDRQDAVLALASEECVTIQLQAVHPYSGARFALVMQGGEIRSGRRSPDAETHASSTVDHDHWILMRAALADAIRADQQVVFVPDEPVVQLSIMLRRSTGDVAEFRTIWSLGSESGPGSRFNRLLRDAHPVRPR